MKRASVFWFTGLSGSGKTTVATALKDLLKTKGFSVLVLDGDEVRKHINRNLGFSEEDIKKNNVLIAELCKQHQSQYDVILVSIISPYKISRKMARDLLGRNFYEIYFSADLETVIKRDTKGLYAKAKSNALNNLIGFSNGADYEPPDNPDFIVNTSAHSVEYCVNRFGAFVINKATKDK